MLKNISLYSLIMKQTPFCPVLTPAFSFPEESLFIEMDEDRNVEFEDMDKININITEGVLKHDNGWRNNSRTTGRQI